MRISKVIPSVILACTVLATPVSSILSPVVASAAASESSSSEVSKLKLYDLYVNVPYTEDEYSFVRTENSKEVRIDIIDKATGKKVDAYGELIPTTSKNKSQSQTQASGYYENRTVYKDKVLDDFATVRINLNLNLYFTTGSSFGQINKVNGVNLVAASSGLYTIADPAIYADSATGSYPTGSISVSGSGVVDTTTSSSGGVSLGVLGYTVGTDQHFRKPFDVEWTYSLY
ncbi:hypothetical protein [Paenibacillus sp. YPG26]|uniref:hypothetical protein n=1 Tax=Paenibacillus sp. YPG26 TaxID=2878915 RepID=UPI00203FBD6B|nr:hypothetical protein [Paenibacillus sp. YPG26]USB32537.1 hypothetical protein LDO05_14705 [Paenibacillus sp. YPG26]